MFCVRILGHVPVILYSSTLTFGDSGSKPPLRGMYLIKPTDRQYQALCKICLALNQHHSFGELQRLIKLTKHQQLLSTFRCHLFRKNASLNRINNNSENFSRFWKLMIEVLSDAHTFLSRRSRQSQVPSSSHPDVYVSLKSLVLVTQTLKSVTTLDIRIFSSI